MAALSNSFEGGTDGVAISTGNSGGSSGDAWGAVTIDPGATCEYDNAFAAHGSVSGRVATVASGSSYVAWTSGVTAATVWHRAYFRFAGNPAAAVNIIRVLSSSNAIMGTVRINANGTVGMLWGTGTLGGTSTATIPANAWCRIEVSLTAGTTTGAMSVRLFFTSPNGTTAEETLSVSSVNTGASNPARLRVGVVTNTASVSAFNFDDIASSDVNWIGPVGGGGSTVTGVAIAAGGGTATASGKRTVHGVAVGAGGGIATSAGRRKMYGAAAAAGGGTAAAAGVRLVRGAASGQGGGTAAAAGIRTVHGIAAAQGGGTGAASGQRRVRGGATGQGGGTAQASGTRIVHGAASASGGGTALASGATAGEVTGTASAHGGGTATASGKRTVHGAASAAGGGTASASGRRIMLGTAVATGGGSASASGVRRVRATAVGTGGGSAAATGLRKVRGLAAALGGGTAVGSGRRKVHGSATALGGGSASASGSAPTVITGVGVANGGGVARARGVVTSHQVQTSGGGWYGLLDILREGAELARAEREQPPVACPNDGMPLVSNGSGQLGCTFDGWRWSG